LTASLSKFKRTPTVGMMESIWDREKLNTITDWQ
jgi:hypothetical protein